MLLPRGAGARVTAIWGGGAGPPPRPLQGGGRFPLATADLSSCSLGDFFLDSFSPLFLSEMVLGRELLIFKTQCTNVNS